MPDALTPLLTLLAERATYLAPILVLAVLLGEPLAQLLHLPDLQARIGSIIARLNRKLNRTKRSTATRLYRGIAALLMLVLPTLALGLLLTGKADWLRLLVVLLLVALFGALLRPYQLLRLRREAKAGRLTLQSADPPFLFPDTHALLRYTILTAADRLALTIGAGFYFLLADLPGLLCYLMLAATARFYAPTHTGNRAFGWAADALFTLCNALPRALTSLLTWLAALFTAGTAPFSTLRHLASSARTSYGWLAYLLGLSLGGPVPALAGPLALPWIGTGTPKPEATHLSRALLLVGVALLLWLLLLASAIYYLPADK